MKTERNQLYEDEILKIVLDILQQRFARSEVDSIPPYFY